MTKSHEDESKQPEVVSRRSDVTFSQIAEWASNDSHLLEREMLKAVREVVGQAGVKMRIAGLLLARKQLQKIQRMSELIEGDGGLEAILFDKKRLRHMKNDELIKLYSVATSLRHKTESAYINAVLNPKAVLSPDPEDLRAAIRSDELLEEDERDFEQQTQKAILEKVSKLSDRVVAKQMSLVSDPPVI